MSKKSPLSKAAKPAKPPKLPKLLERKIYKTGQTRGADDDVIYQNRVSRSSTVLIPFGFWDRASSALSAKEEFESGFIALVSPSWYFTTKFADKELSEKGLVVGKNALLFYETRADWHKFPPRKEWKPASKRRDPLGGHFVTRIPATTAITGGERIIHGFSTTKPKGAGIRVYEYASSATVKACRLQLEALVWMCVDAESVLQANGMTQAETTSRKSAVLDAAERAGLLDYTRLRKARMINDKDRTICPLCLEELPAQGFFSRMEQAEGRVVPDLTVTQLNLFHIEELRYGHHNHRPYNIGWGHHHCNVVAKDLGIDETLEWMRGIVKRNQR